MKNQYLPSALTLLFLFLFACGFSQDLDLIVTTKGDSIACLNISEYSVQPNPRYSVQSNSE